MLSDKLRQLRKQRNLTQSDVAKHLQISRQAYSSYETGKREMDFDSFCCICDFYKVSADFLLGRYDIKPFLLDNDDEIEVIKLYRTLDDRGKATVKANLTFESTQASKQFNSKGEVMGFT